MSKLDQMCINTIRFLSVDAVQKANSGHPGLPMGAAPMAYVLWTRHLRHNPANPEWADRDRFVLSAGHGSMLLYSLLHLTGYDLPLSELQSFRQWGSKTPGHPESHITPGVEITSGPLGQGVSAAVGMAIAEAHLAARYNVPPEPAEGVPANTIVDHYTYVIASDGDLMEGVASEACSLAGHLRLGKLIVLFDDNLISLGSRLPRMWASALRPTAGTCRSWMTGTISRRSTLPLARQRQRALGHRSSCCAPSLVTVRPTNKTPPRRTARRWDPMR